MCTRGVTVCYGRIFTPYHLQHVGLIFTLVDIEVFLTMGLHWRCSILCSSLCSFRYDSPYTLFGCYSSPHAYNELPFTVYLEREQCFFAGSRVHSGE